VLSNPAAAASGGSGRGILKNSSVTEAMFKSTQRPARDPANEKNSLKWKTMTDKNDEPAVRDLVEITMHVVKIFLKAMTEGAEGQKTLDRYQGKLDEFLNRAKNGEIIELDDILRELIADEKKVEEQKKGSGFYIPSRQKNNNN